MSDDKKYSFLRSINERWMMKYFKSSSSSKCMSALKSMHANEW